MAHDLKQGKSGIQLRNIVLLESIYRMTNFDNLPKVENLVMHVSLANNITDAKIDVHVKVTVQEVDNENFIIDVTMAGVFVKENPVPFSNDQFIKVNGPAIVYPYVRQHIRTLTLESGIPPILLPVYNFAAIANKNQETDGDN